MLCGAKCVAKSGGDMEVSAKCSTCKKPLRSISLKLPFDTAAPGPHPTISACPHCGARGAIFFNPENQED